MLMTAKVFENISSSAIFRIKVEDSAVFVTFQSKIDKEYEYSTDNVENFVKSVENVLKDNEKSIGSFINKQIRSKVLKLDEKHQKDQ